MARKNHTEFHKCLMEQDSYPSALRRIKFEETLRSYFYRTGDNLYKIRKTSPLYPSIAIKERFSLEALRLGRHWAPDVVQEILPVVRHPDGRFGLGGAGETVDFSLRMTQLSDTYWLYKLVPRKKLPNTAWGRLARYLAEKHAAAPAGDKATEMGRMEHFRDLFEEVFYQAKKYLGITLSQPMLDTIILPMNRFLEDGRKLFLRRQKKHRIVECHGAFTPEHIYIKGGDIYAVSPLDSQAKYRMLDSANDVATLVNGLLLLDAVEESELFLKRYVTASKDRDLMKILPAYQTMRALQMGMVCSERAVERPEGDEVRETSIHNGQRYYNLAVQTSRRIPREL